MKQHFQFYLRGLNLFIFPREIVPHKKEIFHNRIREEDYTSVGTNRFSHSCNYTLPNPYPRSCALML
jgi:hypothetical protein